MAKLTPYHFFLKYAGWSYTSPADRMSSRVANAQKLAAAEARAKAADVRYEWRIDPDVTSADFSDAQPAYRQWMVAAYTADGQQFAGLSAIDFGEVDEPHSKPYGRVVEAELALELPEPSDEPPVYHVLVSNIGYVYQTTDKADAEFIYDKYVAYSKTTTGRTAGEAVTLLQDDEPIREHASTLDGDTDGD